MLETIREVICRFVDIDPNTLTEDTNIRSELGLNSLELINIAVAIEDEFDVHPGSKTHRGQLPEMPGDQLVGGEAAALRALPKSPTKSPAVKIKRIAPRMKKRTLLSLW